MHNFKNILVGVDLTKYRRLDVTELRPPAREVINHAIWLARQTEARLLFFASFNISEEAFHHLAVEERTHLQTTIEQAASEVLAALVTQAEQAGVKAQHKMTLGPGWLEIIHQVQRGGHDLVVIGTSEVSGLRRMLFGNTALKLLRRCPCPVWVVKPGHAARPLNILIATGLKSAGVEATRLGLGLGRRIGEAVHVLHVVEYPLDYVWSTAFPDSQAAEYHDRVRASARKTLHRQLQELDEEHGNDVHIHLADGVGVPDVAIQHFIHVHKIDLLVMGTIARGGVPGVLIGNTAERLLPEVQCSLLAVKPPDFQCPVQLGPNE
jgi:universal stress protein E